MKLLSACLLLLMALFLAACGDRKGTEDNATQATVEPPPPEVQSPPTAAFDLADGVKEALRVASSRAVERLTGPEGIGSSEALRIPLPPAVEKLRSPLSAIGQEGLLDRFSDTLNTSAVEALKVSPAILEETLQKMELSDVADLWRGGDDAFTRFLDRHARDSIRTRMMPSIQAATQSSGAAQTFKTITSALGEGAGGFLQGLRSLTGIELPDKDFDLDAYVADEAMDRLFTVIAAEEKKLRKDPVARSSEILKNLFKRFSP